MNNPEVYKVAIMGCNPSFEPFALIFTEHGMIKRLTQSKKSSSV